MCGQANANIDFRGQKSRAELKKERAGNVGPTGCAIDNAARCYCSDYVVVTRAPIDYTHLSTPK